MVKLSAAEFIREARRRRVFRTAGLYIVGAWVVVQIALAAFPALSISDSAVRYVWIAAILGFPVALVFGWRYDIRGGGIVRAGPDDDVPLPLQRADYAVLLALLAIALVIGAGSLREITKMEPTQLRLAAPEKSLAVLPFANMSADPDNEYFSDGLTETLLHMLAQLADLKVSARTSSFAFKGRNVDIRDIALELGVRHVLEGSVQKAGDRVRVTAQLIRAEDGFHVWSQNYDRQLVDIFAIQDEIAADVADALGSTLLTAAASGIQGIETDDFSAYDIYLKALEQQNINSSESLEEAEALFAAAIEMDPEFVDAKLGLARNYNQKYWKFSVRYQDPEELRVAQSLVGEVLETRPDNLSAQVMDKLLQFFIGYMETSSWGSEESLEALIDDMLLLAEQGPIDSFVTSRLATNMSSRGRHEEALVLLLAALETDPLNIDLLDAQSNIYRHAGRLEEAKQPVLVALRIQPDNPTLYEKLGWLEVGEENYVEGLDLFRQASIVDPENGEYPQIVAEHFYRFGLVREGDRWFERLRAMLPDGHHRLVDLEITAAAALGDQGRLLRAVERALPLMLVGKADYWLPTMYYPSIMGEQGRSQEALDYLSNLVPGLQDYDTLIADSRIAQYLQLMSVPLQRDVMDRESYLELAAKVARHVEEIYPDVATTEEPGRNTINKALYALLLDNNDQALELLREGNADWPMFTGEWFQLLSYPWFGRFREDPEIAAAIEAYEEKKARIADELREMLQKPEWQDI